MNKIHWVASLIFLAKILILTAKMKLFRENRNWKYNTLIEVKKQTNKKLQGRTNRDSWKTKGKYNLLKETDLEQCVREKKKFRKISYDPSSPSSR